MGAITGVERGVTDARPGLRHEAAFYAGAGGFLARTLPFLQGALEADEPALVMVGPDQVATLRAELGADARRVAFADMHEVGANPAWIIPAWRDFVDAHADRRALRGIGEPIWAGRSDVELVECQRHEQLLNVAFAGGPRFWLLCPYDTTTLPAAVLDEAHASHLVVSGADGGGSGDAGPVGPEFDAPLTPPPADALELCFDARTLRDVRELVQAAAVRHGIDPGTTSELVLAVHELATNSVRHGGGRGVLRVWADEPTLLCEVSDAGFITDPLAGRTRPPTALVGRRGLWLAHQLCRLVQLRTSPEGTTVRLHTPRGAAPPCPAPTAATSRPR